MPSTLRERNEPTCRNSLFASRTACIQVYCRRDKIFSSGMYKDPHLSFRPLLKRFHRGRHDRGR